MLSFGIASVYFARPLSGMNRAESNALMQLGDCIQSRAGVRSFALSQAIYLQLSISKLRDCEYIKQG